MLGAVAEGVRGVNGKVGDIRTGGFVHRPDGGVLNGLFGIICVVDMADMHVAGGEVDLERRLLVNATQIAHEYAIDVHPDVVVTRELKDHILAFGGLATVRLDKLRGHGHAKVVVKVRASINDLLRGEAVAHLIKNLFSRVKGEELAQIGFATRIALIYARLIVDVKGVGRGVIHGIVTVRAVRVVDVIAILELEEAFHVVVDSLTILLIVIKEIGQRFIGAIAFRAV